MKSSSMWRKDITGIIPSLPIVISVSVLISLLSSCARSVTPKVTTMAEKQSLETWRIAMAQTPLPKNGSFEATYPDRQWHEVPSTTAPLHPQIPRHGPRPLTVGDRNDVMAQVPSGFISTAIGSFDSVTGVTSESGPINNIGPAVADAYTLQLNTNFFTTTDCSGSSNASCQGFEQFVFDNIGTSGTLYIQYWLINYGTTTPSGWSTTPLAPGDCYKNSAALSVPNQPITNLGQLSLSGTVSSTGDSATLSTGAHMYAQSGNNAVNAAAGWTMAEFNIFGDGSGGQASFNSGSTISPRVRVIYGGSGAPMCAVEGFTGETNNLSFGPSAPAASTPGPALIFTESSSGGATANCSAATTVGDTHLTTFNGLLYDFQASGDFILAEVDPDFVVQTRQVSGAPAWPNASVNSAVATRMGKTRVIVCLGPHLMIDDKAIDLGDGKSLSAPDGVDISRQGNVYFITSQNGNSVRATVNATWIDVLVGLGNCCAQAKGLLANPNGNVNQLVARNGIKLTNPFSFEDVYHRYGDSWRVSPKESLLTACQERNFPIANPNKPFYARDLDAKLYERARAVSKAAGVKEGPLLDAATLDVAVIGTGKAAQAFVGAHAPVAVGKLVNASAEK